MLSHTSSPLPSGRHNVRDLGGLPLAAGGTTQPLRVLRACAMQHIGPEGREALLGAGLRTVIDLRSDSELETEPPAFRDADGVTTLSHPVFAGMAPVASLIEADHGFRWQHRYTLALRTVAPRFAAVIEAVAKAPPGLVVVHCTAGKDRTGLISALLLDLAGVRRDAIVADYARTADYGALLIDTLRTKAFGSDRPAHVVETILGSPAEAMEHTLVMLDEEFGGALGYLETAGLRSDVIRRASERLLV